MLSAPVPPVIGVGRRRSRDRDARRQRRGVDILEVGDRDEISRGLVRIRQVDRRGRSEHQRIRARAAIDRNFRAAIGHRIVAGARGDDVGAARAIDGVGAGATGEEVRSGRSGNRNARRERAGVDIFEVGDSDAVARGLIRAGRHTEIDSP